MGRFLFEEESEVFKERGVRKVYGRPGTKKHDQYLKSMGFVPDRHDAGEAVYRPVL